MLYSTVLSEDAATARRPILLPAYSVSQRAPSRPLVTSVSQSRGRNQKLGDYSTVIVWACRHCPVSHPNVVAWFTQ
jgi:hypothetical protein